MEPAPEDVSILVVDDEPSILDVVSSVLRLQGYRVATAPTGGRALDLVRQQPFDLLVLDVMLPDRDGFGIVERLRREGRDVPVVFLTARTGGTDAVAGLRLGADDYIRKPFEIEELVERVRAVLRRGRPGRAGEVVSFADIVVDRRTFRARRGARPLHLTRTELALLEVFVRNGGRVLSKAQIVDLVWDDPDAVDLTTVESAVSRLRRKLDGPGELSLLVTRRGIGYGLVAET